MKNKNRTFACIFVTIFSLYALASDTLSISKPIRTQYVDTISVENISKNEFKRLIDSTKILTDNSSGNSSFQKRRSSGYYKNGTNSADTLKINTLLDFIQNYDVNATRVYPRPVREIMPEDDLDFPKMSPLYMPLVFNNIQRDFKIHLHIKTEPLPTFDSDILDSLRSKYLDDRYMHNITQSILLKAEAKQIGCVKYDKKDLPQPESMIYHLNSRQSAAWMKNMKSIPERNADTKDLPKTEYNPWSYKFFTKLQFSQTYNSPNWSNGGESNMAGLATVYMEANYSDLKKVQFDNNLEAKIGLNTVSNDSLRNLNVSTDQLRMVSKLGVRMYNDLYYSLSGEFITQFLNNYRANTMTFQSSFMSPAKMFIGLGVDYKKTGKKTVKYNFSLLLTPLTCKMSYLYDNVNMQSSSYGIDEGKHFNSELGSKIAATLTWQLSENVQWKSNFYYFTDFTYVDSDWENTIDMNLNNYFTTSFYIHLKLDDRLKRPAGEPLIQMQELFSFGMVYRW